MARVMGKQDDRVICSLPATVTVDIRKADKGCVTACIRNKKGTLVHDLDVSESGIRRTVTIPERLACWGTGRFYVVFRHHCVECAEIPVRFEDGCSVVSCDVEELPTHMGPKKDGK